MMSVDEAPIFVPIARILHSTRIPRHSLALRSSFLGQSAPWICLMLCYLILYDLLRASCWLPVAVYTVTRLQGTFRSLAWPTLLSPET